ncbi:metal/formaldehyde-sensitive transcriptional repressor [Frateuria defendens]|uniref:metal/formaldehyde-sensitive transcriptional repressor n=1 Tax=Frateuria defendens TaxID=2219559 RepID=UPI00066FBBD8|nr:metal/formaldehyde-sensitive transcriptional repressor [Frateuria defendens]
MAHLNRDKDKLIARVRRIGGQVASIERALQGEADCGAVLHQLAAVRGAVQGLLLEVIDGHLREHVATASSKRRQEELAPVLAVLKSYLK